MRKTIVMLAVLGMSPTAFAAPTAAAGKTIYTANCAGCHGAKAEGAIGPNLKVAASWKYDLFKRALLQGKDDKGKALKAMMPKFTKGFAPNTGKAPTDDQIKSLQAYIKSVAK